VFGLSPEDNAVRLRRLARSPLAYWAAVVALAAFTAFTIAGQVDRAGAQVERYGRLRPMVTATRPVEVGSVVRPADVVVRSVPAAFLPEGALGATGAVVGRTVVVALFRGSPIVAGHLAPDGLEGVAALLPAGGRAVAVPTGPASVALRRGHRVDVLATFDPPPAGEEPTFPVAESALVVDVGPEAVALAVAPEEAKRVAYAVAAGVVTLVLTAAVTPAAPARPAPPPPGTPRTGGTTGSAPPAAPAIPLPIR
jgi:Flp pilus assembly protein CpaB